jgi:hypothetical protein
MLEAFRMGGWGMYPTLFFGMLFTGAAVAYARSPERRRVLLLGMLSLLTFVSGVLGFVTGLIVTLSYGAEDPEPGKVIVMGTAESLHNVGLALALMVLGGAVASIGAFRASRGKPEPVGSAVPAPAHR